MVGKDEEVKRTMELLKVEELAERLGVNKSQIYRQTELGRLPVVKIGRYFRYPWPQIIEHLSNGAFASEEGSEGAARQ